MCALLSCSCCSNSSAILLMLACSTESCLSGIGRALRALMVQLSMLWILGICSAAREPAASTHCCAFKQKIAAVHRELAQLIHLSFGLHQKVIASSPCFAQMSCL